MFIVLEGTEATGKTTVAYLLKEIFEEKNKQIILTREPGGVDISEEIRNLIFKYEMDPLTEMFLFQAARREHLLKKVKPALDNNKIVVMDRFFYSTLIYQGLLKENGVNLKTIKEITKITIEEYTPDIVLWLTSPIEVILERINGRSEKEKNRFDNMDISKHQKLLKLYDEMYKEYKINDKNTKHFQINTNKPIEEIKKELKQIFL